VASSTPTLRESSVETQKFRTHMGRISRQSGVFFVGTAFTICAGYLFKVYLARVLGAEALGIYALGMTLVGFFGIFNGLGLPESAVRFIAAYAAKGETGRVRGFLWRSTGILTGANAVFVTIFLLSGSWIATRFYHSVALPGYLYLFALMLPFAAVRTFFEKAMAGFKDVSRRTFIVNFVGTPTTIVIAVLLIMSGTGLKGYLYAQIASSAIVVLLLVLAIRQLMPGGTLHAASGVKEKLGSEVRSFSAVVLGMGFLGFLMAQADKITLGYFLGAKQVGIYAVAAALVAYVPIALNSVNQIFAPTISDLHTRGDYPVLLRLFQTLTKWVIAVTLPLAAVIVVFARPVMGIFGRDFEVGWPILIIGTVGELVNCGVGSVGFLLLMSGHQRRLMKIQIVSAVVVVILNVLLVPHWGILGAAVAAATTNVITNAWYLLQVRSVLHLSPYNRSYFRLVVPTLSTVGVLWALYAMTAEVTHSVPLIIGALLVSYTVFLAGLLLFGLTEDDRMILATARQRLEGLLAG